MNSTYRSRMGENQAEFARRNGLMPGMRLAGNEGYGVTVIEIVNLEDRAVRARAISHDGKPTATYVNSWNLGCRDWTVVA